MSDYTLLIEACKIAQALDGPQNLSAIGIGNYLRKCSPEVVLGLIESNARLANEVQRLTEKCRLEWSRSQGFEAELNAIRSSAEGKRLGWSSMAGEVRP